MAGTPTTSSQAEAQAPAVLTEEERAVLVGIRDRDKHHSEILAALDRASLIAIIDRLTAGAPTQTAQDALIDALDKTGIPAAVERAREKAAPAPTTTLRCVACKREFRQPAPAPTMPKIDDLVTPQIVKKAADAGERVGWETVLTPKAEIHHRVQDLQKYEAALKSVLPDILALFTKGS